MKMLNENQIITLDLYLQLEKAKFGKTKEDKYKEIAKRTKFSLPTIRSWIYRHIDNYIALQDEKKFVQEKNAENCNIEGLTAKQIKYFIFRMYGISKEESKIKAGYSPNTKAANIEKSKGVAVSMATIRAKLINDTKIGAEAIINELVDIKRRAKEGTIITEYVDEVNPDGRITKKTVRKEISYQAEIAAIKELNNMLGFNYLAEVKAQRTPSSDGTEVSLSDDDFN